MSSFSWCSPLQQPSLLVQAKMVAAQAPPWQVR
jgi:hypothetical protein